MLLKGAVSRGTYAPPPACSFLRKFCSVLGGKVTVGSPHTIVGKRGQYNLINTNYTATRSVLDFNDPAFQLLQI